MTFPAKLFLDCDCDPGELTRQQAEMLSPVHRDCHPACVYLPRIRIALGGNRTQGDDGSAMMSAQDLTGIYAAVFEWRVAVRARHFARKLFEQCVSGSEDCASLEYRQAVQRYRVAAEVEAAAYSAMGRAVCGLIDRGIREWSELAGEFGLTDAVVSNLRVRHSFGVRGTLVSEGS